MDYTYLQILEQRVIDIELTIHNLKYEIENLKKKEDQPKKKEVVNHVLIPADTNTIRMMAFGGRLITTIASPNESDFEEYDYVDNVTIYADDNSVRLSVLTRFINHLISIGYKFDLNGTYFRMKKKDC